MKTDVSGTKWPLAAIIGIICVVALLALITRSIVRVFRAPPEAKATVTVQSVAAVSNTPGRTEIQPDEKAISAFNPHPVMIPAARPTTAPSTGTQRTKPVPARAEFNTDSQQIRERTKEQRATIENIRQSIRSGEKDTNTIMRQEKNCRKSKTQAVLSCNIIYRKRPLNG